MEVVGLKGNWFSIAKAEFLVQTSGIRSWRNLAMIVLVFLGLAWALALAPVIMGFLLDEILGFPSQVLIYVMPSLMRFGMMFIWFILLIYPLTFALQEIKIGQWEVLLSNNVSTRDIFVGTFVGKLPVNGLLVLFLAPVLISPFALALQISILGQALMYIIVLVVTLSTVWLGNLLATFLQAKLGESPRGRDLANALALILSFAMLIPMLGFQLFQAFMLEILGLDIFLAFPFTWSADIVTRVGFSFNGIGLTSSTITALDSALGLSLLTDAILLGGSTIIFVLVALVATDRLFTLNIGMRTESVTTATTDNILIRAIRRILPGSFGILLITTMKDFGRKAQNISRIALFLVLAIVIPLYAGFRSLESGQVDIVSVMVTTALMLAFTGSYVYGGIGFLESRDQLWLMQSTPQGAVRYVKAKIAQAMFFNFPIALIPVTALTILFNLDISSFLLLMAMSIIAATSSALIGIGVTASNPTYEDTKSDAFKKNMTRSIMLTAVSFGFYMIADFVLSFLGFSELMNSIYLSQTMYLVMMIAPLPFVGILVVMLGVRNLAKPL
jgi:hypothetical protein